MRAFVVGGDYHVGRYSRQVGNALLLLACSTREMGEMVNGC